MIVEVVTGCLKWMDRGIAFGLLPLASFRWWLFSRMLKAFLLFLLTVFYNSYIPSDKLQGCFYSLVCGKFYMSSWFDSFRMF